MNSRKSNEKSHEIISVTICILVVVATLISGSAGKLSLASAEIMFRSPKNESSQSMPETSGALSVTKQSVTIPNTVSDDITQTPADILAIIKKYTELLADDKRDADIKATTYGKTGATHIFENIKVRNTTDTKSLDIEKVLAEPFELSVDKSKPSVLIFHSHTSEGYELIERSWYAEGSTSRSNDEAINVVRVGTEIENYLTEKGYTVIHDKTIHDDNYTGSYPHSRKTIEKLLAENPQIQIVLDIHRDSITLDDGTKIKPITEIGGKKAAQLMIITGAQEGKVEDFPDWEYNLRFALRLQKRCEDMFPGLMRPVLFSQRKYNMDITHFSLLIEMGSEANTLEEACYSGRLLASALASLMDEYAKGD